jgi:hypothetical protein
MRGMIPGLRYGVTYGVIDRLTNGRAQPFVSARKDA